VGGGGGVAGACLVAQESGIKVYGVEPEGATLSLRAWRPAGG
jgi:threonine dehydratase